MSTNRNKSKKTLEAIVFLAVFFAIFGYLAWHMSLANMLNTIMQTSYHLLLETVFYIMGITVLTGALSALLSEFGVVELLEKILRPLMKPLYNLPGVSALAAVMTFLSDNPAIITLAKNREFSNYFKKYQLISLTNFGTAFGMGLVVIAFMASQGYAGAASVGLAGAVIGSIVSTRLMQYFIVKEFPKYQIETANPIKEDTEQEISFTANTQSIFIRALNAVLDGGKSGVDIGMAIIPGVLFISTFVMILTFGPSATGEYTGAAYEGVALLPFLADKVDFIFEWLFGFTHPEQVAFPITSLGAVGAALGLIPRFISQELIDDNAIVVFTAMGMCWSGYLSTHAAMLDALGYRKLISKAILAHTIGGLMAGIAGHWLYVGIITIFS